jgi:transcriptional regulator with XRE-family HTH domain
MSTPELLRKSRLKLKLTQPQLAERLGVDTSTVWRWEKEGLPERGTASVLIAQIIAEASLGGQSSEAA